MHLCGSAVTPVNGQDLSLLSILATAEPMEAASPFAGNAAVLGDDNRLNHVALFVDHFTHELYCFFSTKKKQISLPIDRICSGWHRPIPRTSLDERRYSTRMR
jgi:hypothetical protein